MGDSSARSRKASIEAAVEAWSGKWAQDGGAILHALRVSKSEVKGDSY